MLAVVALAELQAQLMRRALLVEHRLPEALDWLQCFHLDRQLHSLLDSGLFRPLGKNHQSTKLIQRFQEVFPVNQFMELVGLLMSGSFIRGQREEISRVQNITESNSHIRLRQ